MHLHRLYYKAFAALYGMAGPLAGTRSIGQLVTLRWRDLSLVIF